MFKLFWGEKVLMPLFPEQHSLNFDHGTSPSANSAHTSSKANSVRNSAASNATTNSPHTVPLFISLLISQSFFHHEKSPASTLIIPFFKKEIPYAYVIIVILEFITAFLVKWYYGPSYNLISLGYNTGLPDLNALRYALGQSSTPASRESNRQNQQQPEESTPLLPSGLAFNISFSSPFTAPTSKASTLYTIQLKQIKNMPGFLVPLAALMLYFILAPHFKAN